ncbi:hypothetical protein P3S68_005843 [Capsicum galapagoense]
MFSASQETVGNILRLDTYSDVNGGRDEMAVWIANRDDPITDTSGILMATPDGSLMISHSEGNVILFSATPTTNLTAVLLDNGNFVLGELDTYGSVNRVLWQSFDYPTDTLLPGMKLGINLRTAHKWSLTSWVNDQVPASGSFTFGLDPNGTNQLIILGMVNVYWRSGPWPTGQFDFNYVSNEDEEYFIYTANGISGYTMSPSGLIQDRFEGNAKFGNCSNAIPDAGCVKQNYPMSLSDCKAKCENNCWCVAYASVDSDTGTGCEIWGNGERFETVQNGLGRGVFFLTRKGWEAKMVDMADNSCVPNGVCFHLLLIMSDTKKTQSKRQSQRRNGECFKRARSLETINMPTNNFSSANNLGEGGYGPVYKGMLLDGQEIAIKRLSRSSGQGLVEFQNEIMLIAKLQHTNLVKLLGCCIEGEEKLLVYEYMTNKSLDFFLFVPSISPKWNTRLNTIEGVAQGLLYLHKYSRLRVIHRDLKASNILLDDNMNPKISDFGLATIFGRQEFEANTERIVGTHGYMSPEYAMNGIVSTKTDIFSVLVLEILSGKRNNSCYHLERPLNLVGYAWELWKAGRVFEELTEPVLLNESTPMNEVMRCIHVGLLCVQANPMDRPSMSSVVMMLTNDSLQLPVPRQPAFFIGTAMAETETHENVGHCSTNGLSISDMVAR